MFIEGPADMVCDKVLDMEFYFTIVHTQEFSGIMFARGQEPLPPTPPTLDDLARRGMKFGALPSPHGQPSRSDVTISR